MNEEVEINQLPNPWLQRTLGDVVTKRSVKATPQQFPDAKFIGMDCIEPHSLRPSFLYDFKEFKSSGNLFEENEVLYGRMRPYLNKVYRAEFGGACSGEFIVMKCKDNFDPNYLKYILHSKSFVRFANEKTSGDRPRISFDEISAYSVLVPPLKCQSQIVSKIEELFSELDRGIAEVKTVQQQLKVYRQAVLKLAFEGKLTNEKVKEGELPQGWNMQSISQVATTNPKIPKRENLDDDLEIQFLPMKLVEEIINKIHLTETKKFKDAQKGSYTPFINGDIIFAKVTPCMENGKVAVVDNLKNGIGYGSSEFHVLRCSDELLNKYLFYFVVQDRFRNEAQHAMTGAVGLRRVPKQFIENHAIPVPPFAEQQKIVQEIESRLSVCDKIEETITNSLKQAEALRQSILKKAFEGKLV